MADTKKLSLHGQQFPYLDYSVVDHGRDLTYTWGPKGIRWDTGLGVAYLTSDGFDATDPDKLRLSPQVFSLNRTTFSAKPGFMYETTVPVTEAGLVDAVSATSGTGALTVSHTVGTGNDRLLCVAVFCGTTFTQTDVDILPAFGGVSLDFLSSSTVASPPGWAVYYLTAPASGAANVTWANTNGRDAVMLCISFKNVNQIDPFGNVVKATGSSTTPSVMGSFTDTDIGLDFMVVANNSSATAGAGQTDRGNQAGTGIRAGISTQAGNVAGDVMSWTVTSGTWRIGTVPIRSSETANAQQVLVADSEYTHKFSFNGSAISSVTAAVQKANAEYTGFLRWNGVLYLLGGSSIFTQVVTPGATTDTYTDTNWYGICGTQFQDAATPELAIADYNGVNVNRIGVAALGTAGVALVLTDFSSHGNVGDFIEITGLVESSAFLGVAKKEGLWEIDSEGVARLVLKVATGGYNSGGTLIWENGLGTVAFGDVVFYPASNGLWLYYIGRDVSKQGVEALELPRVVNTGLTGITLQDRRPYTPIICANWIYYSYANTTKGAVIAARFRRTSDPAGKSELLQHMLWDLGTWKGGLFTLGAQLWMKGATFTGASRNVSVMQLASSGDPGAAANRGMVSTAHRIALLDGEGNILRPLPGRTVQLRHGEIVTANGFGATTSLQLRVYRDSQNSADNIGSAITSDGLTNNLTMTVGTTDTGERWIPELVLTTNGSYAPSTQDPWVQLVRLVFRTPQVIQIIIPADYDSLQTSETQLTYNTARKLLQGYLSQGPGTVLPPAQLESGEYLGTSYTGEVIEVEEGFRQGKPVFILKVVRWTTD